MFDLIDAALVGGVKTADAFDFQFERVLRLPDFLALLDVIGPKSR